MKMKTNGARASRLFLTAVLGLLSYIGNAQAVDVVTYYHTDGLGTPVMESNAAGQVTYTREHRPYGEQSLGAVKNGPGFTGHVGDADTGLIYMQARYYDPAAGRFLSNDPVAANVDTGGNSNRYWYANNNPYRFTDPDGRVPRGYSDLCSMWCDSSYVAGDPRASERETGETIDLSQLRKPEAWLALNEQDSDSAQSDRELERAQIENLVKAFFELLGAKESPFGQFSKIFQAKEYGQLSADEMKITMQWGVRDIETYRATDGLHVTNPVGSLVPWQQLRVNWRVYDPGPKWNAFQMMGHFLRRVRHEGYIEREP